MVTTFEVLRREIPEWIPVLGSRVTGFVEFGDPHWVTMTLSKPMPFNELVELAILNSLET